MRDLYDPLIGSWDVESSLAGAGEWHFERVFGGLGVQDTIFPVGAPPERHGITLRSFDEEAGVWRAFYTSPGDREFVALVGRADGDRIVHDGEDLTNPGRVLRWTFLEVAESSFVWHGEASADGGATWALEHEMRAARRP